MTLDPEELRRAMRNWTTGVTVVTAAHQGQQHGMTVSSFTSVALEPPLVLISLQTASRTHELVTRSKQFGVSILSADQQELSDRFAGRIADNEDRMAGLNLITMISGAPLLKDSLAQMDCHVVHTFQAGTNTAFIGEVLSVRSPDVEAHPLIYFNRSYRRLDEA